jgi:hypothetical protein
VLLRSNNHFYVRGVGYGYWLGSRYMHDTELESEDFSEYYDIDTHGCGVLICC